MTLRACLKGISGGLAARRAGWLRCLLVIPTGRDGYAPRWRLASGQNPGAPVVHVILNSLLTVALGLWIDIGASSHALAAEPGQRPGIGLWCTVWWTQDDQCRHWTNCHVFPTRGRYTAGDPAVIAAHYVREWLRVLKARPQFVTIADWNNFEEETAVEDSFAWEDGQGHAVPEIADVRFQDCELIRTTYNALDIQCGDRALVHDIRYENIRVETDEVSPAPRMQGGRNERYLEAPTAQYVPDLLVIVIRKNAYSKDAERGNVRDITYADVSVTGKRAPRSFFNGLDAQHAVQGVTIDNLRLNGKLTTTATEANLTVGPNVSDVRFGKPAK